MVSDVLYSIENPPPLNSAEQTLKDLGYICHAACLTKNAEQVQHTIENCCHQALKYPGLEITIVLNGPIVRFWMRTPSLVPTAEKQNRTKSSLPPPLPITTAQPTLSSPFSQARESESFAGAGPTIPSDKPEGMIDEIEHEEYTTPPGERVTLASGATSTGVWREPGSLNSHAMPPPPLEPKTDIQANAQPLELTGDDDEETNVDDSELLHSN